MEQERKRCVTWQWERLGLELFLTALAREGKKRARLRHYFSVSKTLEDDDEIRLEPVPELSHTLSNTNRDHLLRPPSHPRLRDLVEA